MSSNKSTQLTLALCLIALVGASASPLAETEQQQQQQQPAQQQQNLVLDDKSQLADEGGLFLPLGQQCSGPNEELHPGAVPTCEPTCSNPRPMCLKIFYTSLDFVPCFCKKPLVRDERTRECVELSKCPKLAAESS